MKYDNNIYVSSKVLITEMIMDYNIQSSNFIPKIPIWICNALGELNIYQATIENPIEGTFDGGTFQLPYHYKSIVEVKINNEMAIAQEQSLKNMKRNSLGYEVRTPTAKCDSNQDVYTTSTKANDEKPCHTCNTDRYGAGGVRSFYYRQTYGVSNCKDLRKPPITYYVKDGWMHLSVTQGEYMVMIKSIPIQYDSDSQMSFPMIYNDSLLKDALKMYVLRNMLYSGFKHDVFNLTDNNSIVNPGLKWEQNKTKVRNSVNSFTKSRREDIAKIMTQLWI